MVQWLGRHASTAVGMGLIPGRGIKIPHETQGQTKKKKKNLFGEPTSPQATAWEICWLPAHQEILF